MSQYKPNFPFNVPLFLLVPAIEIIKGAPTKTYSQPSDDLLFYASFRSFGGTESERDGVITVLDTAVIETWYRPDIKADCRVCLAEDHNKVYEIKGTPENINMRNQYMRFKVQAVGGGA